jgi:hypothetical protein
MSTTGYIDPDTGAFLDIATGRGIYVERASTLYTVQFTNDPYDTVASNNVDIPVAPGFTNVVPRSGTIVGACRYSHDLTNCLGDMIHVNISGKVQTKRVATSENVNNGLLSLPFCADVTAGDIIKLQHYSGTAKTVASAMSSGAPLLYYTYVSYKEPYIVADGSAVISSPAQGDVALRQDGTAFLNKPVDVTADFRSKLTPGKITDFSSITATRYGNMIQLNFVGQWTTSGSVTNGDVLFTIDPASVYAPLFFSAGVVKGPSITGGQAAQDVHANPDGTVATWGGTVAANISVNGSLIYFCKGE